MSAYIVIIVVTQESRFVVSLKFRIGDFIKGAIEVGFSTNTMRSERSRPSALKPRLAHLYLSEVPS